MTVLPAAKFLFFLRGSSHLLGVQRSRIPEWADDYADSRDHDLCLRLVRRVP